MHRRANGNDDLKDRILMALRTEARGRKHAILSSDLAEAVGESSRVVRAAISEMRKDGYLILPAVRPPMAIGSQLRRRNGASSATTTCFRELTISWRLTGPCRGRLRLAGGKWLRPAGKSPSS